MQVTGLTNNKLSEQTPVLSSQNLTELSKEAVITYSKFSVKHIYVTSFVCPFNTF